jgi:hypothetical protein
MRELVCEPRGKSPTSARDCGTALALLRTSRRNDDQRLLWRRPVRIERAIPRSKVRPRNKHSTRDSRTDDRVRALMPPRGGPRSCPTTPPAGPSRPSTESQPTVAPARGMRGSRASSEVATSSERGELVGVAALRVVSSPAAGAIYFERVVVLPPSLGEGPVRSELRTGWDARGSHRRSLATFRFEPEVAQLDLRFALLVVRQI